jgi:hypothetical protein
VSSGWGGGGDKNSKMSPSGPTVSAIWDIPDLTVAQVAQATTLKTAHLSNPLLDTVEPGYNDIGLCHASYITSDIL